MDIAGGLTLAASRGLTPEMIGMLDGLKRSHPLVREVTGLGHKVVINNLASSDMENTEVFRRAGIRWMIAVPLMTYRVHGILGAASRYRRRLDKHTPDLIMVTGRLIATALVKTNLARSIPGAAEDPGGNGRKFSSESLQETRNRVREIQTRVAAAKDKVLQAAVAGIPTGEPVPEPVPVEPEKTDEKIPLTVEKATGQVTPEVVEAEDMVATEQSSVTLQEAAAPETPVQDAAPDAGDDSSDDSLPPAATSIAEDDAAGIGELVPATAGGNGTNGLLPALISPWISAADMTPKTETETGEPGVLPPGPPPPATEETIHVYGNGKKPEAAPKSAPVEEDKFLRHSQKMASFRARHDPLP